MKVVIFAGGYGTRLSELTSITPKPLIEIGDMPIIWHIMKIYSSYGYNDFIICAGYKSHMIKKFFNELFYYSSDIEINLKNKSLKILKSQKEKWKITIVETGKETNTGGRLLRVKKYLRNQKNFFLTYGDGLSNINLKEQYEFHKKNKKIVTLTAVNAPHRYGVVKLLKNQVVKFDEKPDIKGATINGGFFIISNKIFNYIKGDKDIFEKNQLSQLAKLGQLSAYTHTGFWHSMDTLRDKKNLDSLWISNKCPWKIW